MTTWNLLLNRSQRTSKCGKNITDTFGYRLVCFLFLPHYDVFCDLLFNRRTATTSGSLGERADSKCFHSLLEFSKAFTSVSI